jgi:hypothetical protein
MYTQKVSSITVIVKYCAAVTVVSIVVVVDVVIVEVVEAGDVEVEDDVVVELVD